jgi:hypothetical protein
MNEQDIEGKVGYGRPPKRTQFKPGQSWNPRGRPKREETLGTIIMEELSRKVRVTNEKGEPVRLSYFQVIAKQIIHKATKADLAAIRLYLEHAPLPEQGGYIVVVDEAPKAA